MKMVFVVADANREEAVRRDLAELGAPGYTELPVLLGAGRTGIHAGDRVHPGALVTFFTVLDDALAERVFAGLVQRRDAAGDGVTRLFLMPVERFA
jgi:nitrogen regulatory protein PII